MNKKTRRKSYDSHHHLRLAEFLRLTFVYRVFPEADGYQFCAEPHSL